MPSSSPRMGRPPKYSAGQVINGLELVERLPKYKGRFRCHCGELFDAQISNVARRNTTSCGCNHTKRHPGDVFNGVEFLERLNEADGRFRCVCGAVFERRVSDVALANRPSCGCRSRKHAVGDTINGMVLVHRLPGGQGEFRCDCGKLFTARVTNVAASSNPSCGCHPRRRN